MKPIKASDVKVFKACPRKFIYEQRNGDKQMPRWRTVRCVVEYRTSAPGFGEKELAAHVQSLLDTNHCGVLIESKPWAKQFNRVVARMKSVRPKRLQSTIRSLESCVNRLRKL